MSEQFKVNTLKVNIVSAEQELFVGEAKMVFATAHFGEIGIAPMHTPLLAALQPGQIRLQSVDGEESVYFISGGIIEVQPYMVTVLADTAVRAGDLDEAAALKARERAEKALHEQDAEFDYAKALAELAQTAARLQAINAMRKRKR